jgi:L-seryl-tRNA(Ser) seleniumtransferase
LADIGLPSHAVRLHLPETPAELFAARMRAGDPPVVGRIADGEVLLDMLSVSDAELPELARAVQEALSA